MPKGKYLKTCFLSPQLLCTSYKNKSFNWSTLKPSQIALAGGAAGKGHAWTEQFFEQGNVLGPSCVLSPPQGQAPSPQQMLQLSHAQLSMMPSAVEINSPGAILKGEAAIAHNLSLHVSDKGLDQLDQRLLPLWTHLGGRLSLGGGQNTAGWRRGAAPAKVTRQA